MHSPQRTQELHHKAKISSISLPRPLQPAPAAQTQVCAQVGEVAACDLRTCLCCLRSAYDKVQGHFHTVVRVPVAFWEVLNKAIGLQGLGITEVAIRVQQLFTPADVPRCSSR